MSSRLQIFVQNLQSECKRYRMLSLALFVPLGGLEGSRRLREILILKYCFFIYVSTQLLIKLFTLSEPQ